MMSGLFLGGNLFSPGRSAVFVGAVLAPIGFAGCALGPDYERPAVATPAAMPDAASVTSSAATVRLTSEPPLDRWWEVFGDARLSELVASARGRNEGLQAAIARVAIARAVLQGSTAPLFPSLSAGGQYANQKQSLSAFDIPGIPYVRPFTETELLQGSADMAYELDLWGRIRRGREAAFALALASEEDRKNVEITLTADVVSTYFDLGEADASLAIARDGVSIRERTLALVHSRMRTGLAQELDERRAEGELEAARAQVPEAERQRAVAQHRLAILLGHPPDVSFEGRPPASFALPPEVPVGLPSTLLERRPDVRAAESRLRARNAGIGQAKAGYFPTVTIIGHFGYAALDGGDLAQPKAQLWQIGPSISIPIFEGGKTYAAVLEAEARTSEAVADYRDVILRAFAEVADAVVGISASMQVRDHEAAAVRAQEQAVALAESQFRKGLVSYIVVLDSQRTLLLSRTNLLRAQRELLRELVRLEKALGGGWTAAPEAAQEKS
jgi:NodT family efflux transporter outer membrane factor (OMF) lipoprotein